MTVKVNNGHQQQDKSAHNSTIKVVCCINVKQVWSLVCKSIWSHDSHGIYALAIGQNISHYIIIIRFFRTFSSSFQENYTCPFMPSDLSDIRPPRPSPSLMGQTFVGEKSFRSLRVKGEFKNVIQWQMSRGRNTTSVCTTVVHHWPARYSCLGCAIHLQLSETSSSQICSCSRLNQYQSCD